MNRISLCLFMAIKFVYFVLCCLGLERVWTWVYDSPMTFTILLGRWVGNNGCPAKSLTKGGHAMCNVNLNMRILFLFSLCQSVNMLIRRVCNTNNERP
jgi:hypothetical protein